MSAEPKAEVSSPSATSSFSGKAHISPQNSMGGTGTTTNQAKPTAPSFWTWLPPWVSTNIRSPHSWKVLIRCWVGCWAAYLIILPEASLKRIGTTGFFALLTSLFLPAYLPLAAFFIIISTLMLGVLLGWGIGVAAMRAANASRNPEILEAGYKLFNATLAASPAARANPAGAFTSLIFKGVFLDTRASAVYACFLGISTFILALIRAYAPKLLFMSVFGTIAADIFCTIGPLFPYNRYTLLNSTAISIASYMGIAVVVTIFIFPETMSHVIMAGVSEQLTRIKAMIAMQDEVLSSAPADSAPGSPLSSKVKGARETIIAVQRQLNASSGFLNLEFTWGKWNGDDVVALEETLLAIITRISSLSSFTNLIGNPFISEDESEVDSSLETPSAHTTNDTYLLQQLRTANKQLEVEHSVGIAHMLPPLRDATSDLRQACTDGVDAVQTIIDIVNTRRWYWNAHMEPEHVANLNEATARLSAALLEFKETKRLQLVEPYLSLINSAKEHGIKDPPLRSLYVSFMFATNLLLTANAILTLMELVRDTSEKRKHNRLWAPKGLRNIAKLLTSRGDKDDGALGDNSLPPVDEIIIEEEESYRRDPDSKPPTNSLQRTMNSVHNVYCWLGSDEAIFTAKYIFISIALWLPAVVKHSAEFYYAQKGVWALIMAQTTLSIYAADQLYNLITRFIGTVIGLIAGLIAWYIGNGRGIGNAYGSAAAVGLLLIPLIFIRVHAPPQYLPGVIMVVATFALIVGYSWVDGHSVQFATPGIGWTAAYKRFTLVVIGSFSSFIMMMLPPQSGRKAVRHRNASSIAALSSVYGFLMSTWIKSSHEKSTDTEAPWLKTYRLKLISIAEELQTIKQMTGLAKWEGSVRGAWPAETYFQLLDVQSEMIWAFGQLGGALSHTEDGWMLTFLQNTKVLNPNFMSEAMSIFSHVSQSLRTGEPMHQVLPASLLDRLFYHHQANVVSLNHRHHHHHHVVDLDEVKSLDFMYYSTALVGVYLLLQSLDELHRLTKVLCGEVPIKGFSTWKNEYDRMHAQV